MYVVTIEYFRSIFIINSFGKNPVIGGIPAKDRSDTTIENFSICGKFCLCHGS